MLRTVMISGIVATILAHTASVQAAVDSQAPRVPSQAQPAARPMPTPVNRGTSIYAIVGFGTPVGLFGLEAVHRLGSIVEVAAGIGFGNNAWAVAANPLQWAFMPRLRLGGDHHAFTLGGGISGGNYAVPKSCPLAQSLGQDGGCSPAFVALGYVLWSNFEMGGEIWNPAGLSFRYFVGYGSILTPDALHCVASLPSCTDPSDIVYAGIGIGHAF